MNNKRSLTTKSIVKVALFAALTSILSQIMLPIGPVPINLATFSVFLAGGLLGAGLGALSQLIYVLLGAIGIPVFAGFGAGFGKLFGPTGGYILGYVATAFIVGYIISRCKSKLILYVLSMVLGLLVCYLMGTLWFMYVTKNNFIQSLSICVFPFLFGDTLKMIIAAILIKRLKVVIN